MPALSHCTHPLSRSALDQLTMAINETSSGPAQWAQLDGGWPPHLRSPHPSAGASDSVVVSATSSPTSISGPTTKSTTTTQQPGIEGGRVGKPVRRRSRASRRAPTTMLNTDTTNFRSMVQQFTGIPSGPYPAGYRPAAAGGGAVSNMGYGFNEPINQTTLMSFTHLQQQHQYQQQSYQFSDNTTPFTAVGGGNGRNDGFLQGLNNSGANMEVGDGFFFDGMYSQMMPRPASTSNKGSDGYFS
ncbi:hypothetical protein Cni_G21042 [Canna indica]|uniref:VQ domain-containing protein n=1 Tax=Canna indica TaxID=4628 RepID=A0AAQ3QGU3_9LILI|nr:hypothetical protein Cni_G21042 [Canna indica]